MLLLHHELIFGHQSWILTNLAGVAILHIVTLSTTHCLESRRGFAPLLVSLEGNRAPAAQLMSESGEALHTPH